MDADVGEARRTTLGPCFRRDDGLHQIASHHIEAAGEQQAHEAAGEDKTTRCRKRAPIPMPQARRLAFPLVGQPSECAEKWISKASGAQRLCLAHFSA
ncbi:hypothetical protein, partial [Herbaspirillum sp. LeCh32-8]|uniref:hypothetical protein n=1 Tax=Herbaspirillum sp. LeCh32-8 TaxID=2821356 RepID=UPI001AE45642